MRLLRLLIFIVSIIASASHAARAELYDDLGGDAGLQQIVNRAVTHWMADARVGPTFAETNMTRFQRLLVQQLCQLTGGPCHYTGRDMATSHHALGLRQAQFNALAEGLQDAMAESGVGYHTQNRVLALLAPMQRDVLSQ